MSNKYLILNASDIEQIDFNQLVTTSKETLTYNADKSKVIIEWSGIAPDFISKLFYKNGPYELEEIRDVIQSSEWRFYPTNEFWNDVLNEETL